MALGPKWGKKWPQNGEKNRKKTTPNPIFSPFLGHFFPISGRGPFSIFRPIFSHFWISARFPFYARQPDSQVLGDSGKVAQKQSRRQEEALSFAPSFCRLPCLFRSPEFPWFVLIFSLLFQGFQVFGKSRKSFRSFLP